VIPYVQEPVWQVFGQKVTAFELCVFAAVVCGYEIVVRRAEKKGWDRNLALNLVLWTMLLGFIGSHTFDVVLYRPAELKQHPWLLLEIWGSMSSFGGLIGGIAGGLLVFWMRRLSAAKAFQFFDIVAYAFPFTWIFGRLGCSLAHDHIGIPSTSFLAVNFPEQPMFDLGLLEFLYTLFIAAIFMVADRKARPTGFFLALFFTLYGPVRFALDMLRTGDERYLGWTPGQYASLAATLFGLGLLSRVTWRAEHRGVVEPS
jgi:phosphatidylglycerol:prolipoprotein diacylglycerol transferase